MTSLIQIFIQQMLNQLRKHIQITEQDLKNQVILKKKDQLYFLLLNRPKANTFNHDFVRDIKKAIDEIQNSEGEACLITCSLNEKIFSAGLDLKYTSNLKHIQDIRYFILQFIAMYGTLAMLNIPTIAVVKGAAIAGGCMLSFSHDLIYVIEKGLFACNQVDIGLPLPPGMNAVIKRKHSNPLTFRDMTLFGRKFTEKEALEYKMIDGIVSDLTPVIEKAKSLAQYGSNRSNFKNLKAENNKQLTDACFNKQHAIGVVGQHTIQSFPKL